MTWRSSLKKLARKTITTTGITMVEMTSMRVLGLIKSPRANNNLKQPARLLRLPLKSLLSLVKLFGKSPIKNRPKTMRKYLKPKNNQKHNLSQCRINMAINTLCLTMTLTSSPKRVTSRSTCSPSYSLYP